MPRIHIIGAPGAGKTTYANKIAKAYNLPLCHSDEMYHDNSGKKPRKRTEAERIAMVSDFAKAQTWVSEGASFSDWVNPVLKRATEIHIVSPSKMVRVHRLIKRYIKRKLGIEKATYKETLSGLFDGIKWTWHYDRYTLPIILKKIPRETKIYRVYRNGVKTEL